MALREMSLHSFTPQYLYRLDEFCDLQKEQGNKVKQAIASFWEANVESTEKACQETLEHLEAKLFGSGTAAQGSGEGAAGGGTGGGGGAGAVLSNIVSKDESQNYRYTVKASKRVEHQRLLHLLRVCDYVIMSTLHEMVNMTLSDLLSHLAPAELRISRLSTAGPSTGAAEPITQGAAILDASARESEGQTMAGGDHVTEAADAGEDGRASRVLESGGADATADDPAGAGTIGKDGKDVTSAAAPTLTSASQKSPVFPVFETEVILEGDDLIFVPSPHEFEQKMEHLIDQYLESVNSNTRLLGNERLTEYTALYEADSDLSSDALASVSDNVTNDDEFKELKEGLKHALASAFELAEACRLSYEPFRLMAIANRGVDPDELKKKFDAGGMGLDDFKASLMQFRAQMADVDKLPDWKDCGILRVDTHQLKRMLAPAPLQAKQKLEELLPRLANEKQKVAMEHVNAANFKLDKRPKSVAEFVELLAFYDEEMLVKEALEANMAYLKKHFGMMEEQRVPVPDEVFATFQFLKPEYERMQQSLEMMESKREEDVATWNGTLDAEIKAFGQRIKEMKAKAENPQILEDSESPEVILEEAERLRDEVAELEEWAKEAQRFQNVFGANLTRYPELDAVVSDVTIKKSMWEAMVEVGTITEEWKGTPIHELNIKDIEATVAKWFKAANRANRELPQNDVGPKLLQRVKVYKDLVPCCADLRNADLQARHWEKIDGVVGRHIEHDPELQGDQPLTLGLLLSYGVMDYQEDIQRISTEATQEGVLSTMLTKVQDVWRDFEFVLNPYKESKDIFVLGGIDEVQAALDDSMVTIGTIMASRYVSGIRPEVEKMETNLRCLQDVLDEWLAVQKNWMYLEPILSAPDIQKQLPMESKKFNDIDKGFKTIMKQTNENPNCMRRGTQPELAEKFRKWNESLDYIQKQLEDYLESKRTAFPRFYFLSNDELLEILAETRNVQAVQPHMMKCFDAIKKLDFGGEHPSSPAPKDENSIDIYGMISSEGEYVSLGQNLKARNQVCRVTLACYSSA